MPKDQRPSIPGSYADRFSEGYKRTAEGVVIMATVVAEVRDAYVYPAYVAWLDANFSLKASTALRLLNVHRNLLASKLEAGVDWRKFALSAIYALSGPSVPQGARDEAIALAEAGWHVSRSDALQTVGRHEAASWAETKASEMRHRLDRMQADDDSRSALQEVRRLLGPNRFVAWAEDENDLGQDAGWADLMQAHPNVVDFMNAEAEMTA